MQGAFFAPYFILISDGPESGSFVRFDIRMLSAYPYAGGGVVRFDLDELRDDLPAFLDREGASCVERASRRRIYR